VRWAFDAVALAACATLTAGILLVVAPEHAGLVGHLWLVAILAIALGVALVRLRAALPRRASPFDAAFAAKSLPAARPASLARIEREVTLSTGTAFDVHYRLRPVLRTVATGLLLRRGIDLERSPERAHAVLGPDVWELVRPDRPPPSNRTAPGMPIAEVERAVDQLEQIAWS
jgi:hypothetical protein